MQTLDLAGKRGLSRDVLAAEAEAEGFGSVASRHELIERVTVAFYQVAYGTRLLKATLETQRLRKRDLELARQRVQLGALSRSRLLEIERSHIRVSIMVSEQAQAVNEAKVELNYLIGRRPDAEITVHPPAEIPDTDLSHTLEAALRSSPAVQRAEARIRAQGGRLERAEVDWVPDISVGGYYRREDGEGFGGVALSIPLPIWDRNQHGVEAARQELGALEQELEATRRRVLHDAYRAGVRLRSLHERVNSARRAAKNAAEAVDQLRRSVPEGEASELDVIRAQILQLMSAADEVRARFAFVTGSAALDRAFGVDRYGGGVEQ